MFMFTNIQYIATVLTYTRGDVFREAVYKNEGFIVNVMLCLVVSFYLMMDDARNDLSAWLGIVNISDEVRMILIVGSILNIAVTYLYELLIMHITKLCGRRNS